MKRSKSPALANCCCRAIAWLSSATTVASWSIASPRTISSSTACRRKCACCASRTSIRLTTVAYCGKTSTRPSSSSRIKASRIGVELTPNWVASSARDSADPGGRSSERIMPRSRSNTCGAAWRSRSSRPSERWAVRREATCGEPIERPSESRGTCIKCTNALVHFSSLEVNRWHGRRKLDEQDDVAQLRRCHRGARFRAVFLAGGGAAEGRNLVVTAARHFLHAEPHHGEAEADREARGGAWRARGQHQMAHLLRRRRTDRCAAGRRRRHPQYGHRQSSVAV